MCLTFMTTLKMHDRNLYDQMFKSEDAGPQNAGAENEGPLCSLFR